MLLVRLRLQLMFLLLEFSVPCATELSLCVGTFLLPVLFVNEVFLHF